MAGAAEYLTQMSLQMEGQELHQALGYFLTADLEQALPGLRRALRMAPLEHSRLFIFQMEGREEAVAQLIRQGLAAYL